MKKVLAALLCLAGTAVIFAQAPFVSIFDGTLKGWVIENTTAGNITIEGGAIRVEPSSGWVRTERQYTDFVLRTEFRFVTPDADSGVFFRTDGAAQFMRGWPNNAYQVQVRNPATTSRFPAVGGLFRHGMPNGEITFDEPLVGKLSRGTGEWQQLEFSAIGNTLIVRFNGTEVTRASNLMRLAGYIGLQAEAGVVEYRALAISER